MSTSSSSAVERELRKEFLKKFFVFFVVSFICFLIIFFNHHENNKYITETLEINGYPLISRVSVIYLLFS